MTDTTTLENVLSAVQGATTKYDVLAVPPNATENEIRIAFRRLALLYHPDRHPEDHRELAHLIFRELSAAYRVLVDPDQRAAYDRSLELGYEFHESPEPPEGPSLRDILFEVQRHEHIFSEGRLIDIDIHLRDAVASSLIQELGEQIVAVYRMQSAPSGSAMQGTFKAGALVVTNLRALLPFSFEWEETQASQKVKYTGMSMPSYALPLVTRILIAQSGGIFAPKTVLRIETAEAQTEVRPQEADLAKILVVARLWAIRVDATEDAGDRGATLRKALFGPFVTAILWTLGILAAAAVVGIVAGGFLDNPMWVLSTGTEFGVWHCLYLLCCIAATRRVRRYIRAYRSVGLTGLLTGSDSETVIKPQVDLARAGG